MTDLYPVGVVPHICRQAGYTSVSKYTASVGSSANYYTPIVYTGVFSAADSTSNNGVKPYYGYSY